VWSQVKDGAKVSDNNKHQGLWVTAFAGTTRGEKTAPLGRLIEFKSLSGYQPNPKSKPSGNGAGA
jgi:hypothetical protein